MTQPAFSRRVQALEEWLGADLFDRSVQPARLTAAGEWLRPQAEEMLARIARLPGQPFGLPLVEAKTGGAVIAYGNFLSVLVNFLILAFIIFVMVRQINRLKRNAPPVPTAPAEEVELLREIRDALRR